MKFMIHISFSIFVIEWATAQELGMLNAKGKKIPTRGRSTTKKARGAYLTIDQWTMQHLWDLA